MHGSNVLYIYDSLDSTIIHAVNAQLRSLLFIISYAVLTVNAKHASDAGSHPAIGGADARLHTEVK